MKEDQDPAFKNSSLHSSAPGLVERRQTIKEIFDFGPLGYFILSFDSFILDVNASGVKFLGNSKGSLINKDFTKYIFIEDQEIFSDCRLKLIETNKSQVCELRTLGSDGQVYWIRLDLSAADYCDESIILVTATDKTIQKHIEDTQSFLLGCSWSISGKDFFEALAEYLAKTLGGDYVCIDRLLANGSEAQTVAVYFDGNFEDNVHYGLKDTPCGQVVGQQVCFFPNRVRKLFPKDKVLQDMIAESYAGLTLWGSNGKPIGLIAVIGRKSLTSQLLTETVLKQVSIRAASELEHRELQKAIVNSRDDLEALVMERTTELQKTNELLKKEIRTRKQNEKSLLRAEEKYRTVADFTYDWETWVAPNGKFNYVSPSCESITGYTVKEFMDDPSLVIKITHPDDREIIDNHYKEKKNRKLPTCSLDFRIVTRDGDERWIGHSCKPVFDANGIWIGQRGSNHDITERKNAERILIESQIKLRTFTHRMDAIAEEERTRIAREIHDELGHLLTALKFDIELLSSKPATTMKFLKSELASMICIVDSLIDSVRKIATELRPGILDHLGLFPAIDWQMEQFQRRTNIICEYDLPKINIAFNSNETNIIYRILQEVLTNVARHSKADKVTVSLNNRNDMFILKVRDNGVGFEPAKSYDSYSLGLIGMYERALSIGGEIEIESAPGKGTMITFSLKRN